MLTGAPIDRISADILGPLPVTPAGNKYILTVTDHFTNWSEAFSIPDQTAITVARTIFNEIISRFGCPATLLSDQGTNFESQILQEMCQLLHIKKTRTSPRHPQGNGKTERFNLTLLSMIKCYIKDDSTQWDQNLNFITAAYRASVHETTGMTPNLLMLGRENRMPLDVMFGEGGPKSTLNHGEHVLHLKETLLKAHEIAHSKARNSAQRQKDNYDLYVRPYTYKVGDKVWYLQERADKGKLAYIYIGPCTISKKHSDLTYQIRMNEENSRRKYRVIHHDKLKPVNMRL